MKRIFRRKSRSSLVSGPVSTRQYERRFSVPSQQEAEVLYYNSEQPPLEPGESYDDTEISPTNSDAVSVALSEADTLAVSKKHRLQLQETYDDNFVSYLPFVLRRMRIEHRRQDDAVAVESDSDDEKTMISMAESPYSIMRKPTAVYSTKRVLVIASEFIKNNTFVFANAEAFSVFKQLRSNRKLRKNSIFSYDERGNIKRLGGEPDSAETIDARRHIVPLDYKLRGEGLPLFKILVPYMSSFRKKVPYMVFRRYHEIPTAPVEDEGDLFETYDFCTIYLKHFQKYKRYTMHFAPANCAPFKVLVFQNNFRPFLDFEYNHTRFRVVGTSLASAYLMNYNPELKLLVIDASQPALCDNIINKQPGFDLRGRPRNENSEECEDPTDLSNPVPKPSNPLLVEDDGGFIRLARSNYIPNEMPPFGRFLDSAVYSGEMHLLPKRYTELGRIELYQDLLQDSTTNLSTTFSVDVDTLVLTTILLTLRETSLRNTSRHSNSASFVGRVGTFGTLGSLSGGPSLGMESNMGYPFADAL